MTHSEVARYLIWVRGLDRAAELAEEGARGQGKEFVREEGLQLLTTAWWTLNWALLVLYVNEELVLSRKVVEAELAHVFADLADLVDYFPVAGEWWQVVHILWHLSLLRSE